MQNTDRCLEIADKLSSGELSVSDGAMAILELVHHNAYESSARMADAILNAKPIRAAQQAA
jgi:hypothetical protein